MYPAMELLRVDGAADERNVRSPRRNELLHALREAQEAPLERYSGVGRGADCSAGFWCGQALRWRVLVGWWMLRAGGSLWRPRSEAVETDRREAVVFGATVAPAIVPARSGNAAGAGGCK